MPGVLTDTDAGMAPAKNHEGEHRVPDDLDDPDDPDQAVRSPTQLERRSGLYVVRRTVRELSTDLAAARELQSGVPTEEKLQLPRRDPRNIEENQRKEAADLARGRAIREGRGSRRSHRKD